MFRTLLNVPVPGNSAQLRRYRLLLLVGAPVYPAWWWVFRHMDPGFTTPITGYLAVAALFLGGPLLTWASERARKRVGAIFVISCWGLTAHYFSVLVDNRSGWPYVVGCFVLVQVVSSAYATRCQLAAYSAYVLGLTGLATHLHRSPQDAILVAGVATNLLIVFIALYDRLETIRSLGESEQSLREERDKTKAILDGIQEGYATLDREFRVTYANPIGLRFLGLAGREYLGRVLWEIFPEAVHTPFYDAYSRAMAGERVELVNEYSPVGKVFEVVAAPAPHGVSIFFRDVTEKRRLQQAVDEQRAAAIAAEKMSTLGEMAAGIAHEINNPLSIIHGKAGQLREGIESGALRLEQVTQGLEKIESTAMRISRIVKALRSFARDGEGDVLQPVAVRQIVDDSLELCREKFRNHGVELVVAQSQDEIVIDCRAVQISQVLINLLANAFDAVERQPERRIHLETRLVGNGVELRVTDSGPGISAQVAEKMFQPFFTTKSVGKGTGLGLSISQGIIEAHSGTLRFEPGVGHTCFVVRLPISARQIDRRGA